MSLNNEYTPQKVSTWQKVKNLPWFVWLPFILFGGSLGYDWWSSGYADKPFHPVWFRAIVALVVSAGIVAIIYGAWKSDVKKRKL